MQVRHPHQPRYHSLLTLSHAPVISLSNTCATVRVIPFASCFVCTYASLVLAGGLPALYGIVILLDDAYALSPGGRSELVVAASTAELQVCIGAPQ